MNRASTIAVDRLFEDLKRKVHALQLEDRKAVDQLFTELDLVVALSGTHGTSTQGMSPQGMSTEGSRQSLSEADMQARILAIKAEVDRSFRMTRPMGDIAGIPVNRAGQAGTEDGTDSPGTQCAQALVGEDLSRYDGLPDAEHNPDDHDAAPPDDPAVAGNFASAGKIARELGVDKSAVTRRIGKNALIGFRGFKRDWLVPREQFKDGDVVPGIAETIALFDNEHQEAWLFLSSGFFYGDADPRPIDRLRALESNDREGLEACLAELESVKLGVEYGVHF